MVQQAQRLLLGLSTLFLFSNSAFSLNILEGQEFFDLFENSKSLEQTKLNTALHLGYCYSSYSQQKEDHIHGENGEIIPIDPETIPEQPISLESSLLWIESIDLKKVKAKASFGTMNLKSLTEKKPSFDELDQRAAVLSLETKDFQPNEHDSSWSFLNSQNQITQEKDDLFLVFEFMIVDQAIDGQLIARKLKILRSLSEGEDSLKIESYCHYPESTEF